MTWWTLHDSNGVIRAHTSILPDPVPSGLTTIEHAERMDQTNIWNPTTRSWEPRPAPVLIDRLQDIADMPFMAEIWQRLTAAQRIKLRRLFVWLLASRRFRQQSEEVSIEPSNNWPTDPALVNE